MSARCRDCDIELERDGDGWSCPDCGDNFDSSEVFTLEVRSAREIATLPEPDDSTFLVGPLLVRGARTIIVADTGHGKTTLALQLAAAALTGWEVFGHFGAGVSCVLVVDLEQGIRSIKRTLRRRRARLPEMTFLRGRSRRARARLRRGAPG